MNLGTAAANSPKTIGDIYFPSLPTKKITYLDNAYGSDVREEVLFIKVNENTGGIIEDKLSEINVYLVFKIDGKQKVGLNIIVWEMVGIMLLKNTFSQIMLN